MHKILYLILAFLFLFFTSCEKEIEITDLIDKFNGNQSVVIPLGSLDAEVSSMISNYFKDNKFVKIDGDDVYFTLTDSSNFVFHYLSFIEKVQPLHFKSTLTNENIFIPSNLQKSFSFTSEIDFGINNNPDYERIDSVIFKTLNVIFNFNNSDITPDNIDSIVIFSERLSKKIVFRKNISDTSVRDIKLFPQSDGKIPVTVSLFYKSALGRTITPHEELIFNMYFKILNFDVAYGFFKPSVLQRQVLTRPLIWNDFLRNSLLRFSNPKIDVQIRTNVGANLRFEFDSVLATYPDQTKIYAVFNGKKSMSENIGLKPLKPGDEITYNLKTFDNIYGKTFLLFDKIDKPDSLIYGYGASLNFDAYSIDKKPDFLLPDSRVYVKIQTKLPFQLNQLSNYVYVDSITEIYKSLSPQIRNIDYGKIDSVFIVLRIKNRLPISAFFTLGFADKEGRKIETDVRSEYKIESGRVDATGKAVEPFTTEIAVLLTKNQFETLRDKLDKLKVRIKFAGMDENSKIHITAQDKISVHAGIFLKNETSN